MPSPDEQYANLKFLDEIVMPFVEENQHDKDTVEMEVWEAKHDCGTHRCVLGWYWYLKHQKPVYEEKEEGEKYSFFGVISESGNGFLDPFTWACDEFGIGIMDSETLFGCEASVEERQKVLDECIQR